MSHNTLRIKDIIYCSHVLLLLLLIFLLLQLKLLLVAIIILGKNAHDS